ncbi:hypothetical protein WISP_59792 [Willisornis vidua]|uniref:Uncharacterized protein n=1 Tax=Willisornis vidua TaxID=1566151 RepID=A0ABQ9DAW6_9PASS|nr:hypothetical protein WISP_59792 [Willisornis vidua]
MHYFGERYQHLYPLGIAETTHQCPPQGDGCSNTCHPLSIIKSPVPRWQSYAHSLAYLCPQPGASQPSLLSCQPYVQKCVVLYPEPCETTRLLPCRKPSLRFNPVPTCQPCETTTPEKKRVAKSLPPCAPRCPEPGKLRFPPCGIRYSASCKDQGRCHKVSKCSSRWYGPDPRARGMTSGYSLPLRGVTECPPQPCATQSYLQERVGGFPQHKCTKGYPTQECGTTTHSSERRLTKCPPEPRAPECPPGKGAKECCPQKVATKGSLPQEGAKTKSSSTQQLSKSRCLQPRATHRPGHHHHPLAGLKRSSHTKRSRCTSKWIW